MDGYSRGSIRDPLGAPVPAFLRPPPGNLSIPSKQARPPLARSSEATAVDEHEEETAVTIVFALGHPGLRSAFHPAGSAQRATTPPRAPTLSHTRRPR